MKFLSFSRAETYTGCQRKFFLEYTQPEAAATPDRQRYFDIGTEAHAAIEYVLRRMIVGEEFDAALAAYEAAQLKFSDGALKRHERVGYARSVRHLLVQCPPMWVEESYADADLGNRGRVDAGLARTPVVDRAGQVTGSEEGPCVVDWKTSRSNHHSPMSIQRSVQLRLYCRQMKTKNAAFVYIDPERPAKVVPVTFTEDDIRQAEQWHRAQRAAITAQLKLGKEAFALASPDYPFCSARWCTFHGDCFPRPKESA